MRLSDPFPASNPVIPAYQKTLGTYTGLGDSITYYQSDRPRQNSDRFNFSLQRQLPTGMVLDVTYYYNCTISNDFHGDPRPDINMVDPRIAYQYKAAVNQTWRTPSTTFLRWRNFPGSCVISGGQHLFADAAVSAVRRYLCDGRPTGREHALPVGAVEAAKKFQKGYSVCSGTTITSSRTSVLRRHRHVHAAVLLDHSDASRHRLSFAGTWEVPLGKGRQYLSSAPRIVDAFIGGWNLTPLVTWRSGRFIRFGGLW